MGCKELLNASNLDWCAFPFFFVCFFSFFLLINLCMHLVGFEPMTLPSLFVCFSKINA